MINCHQCNAPKKVLTYFPSFPIATTTSKKGEPAVLCKKCQRELKAVRFQEKEKPELVLASIDTNGIVFSDGTFNLFPTTK